MDCTHDNESPSKKRTARDAISTGALVAFSYAAVGSNKGFDDLYPELLDLVKEKRMYEKVSVDHGIGIWKRILNHLHTEMVLEGYKEGHFHQENDVRSRSITPYFVSLSLILPTYRMLISRSKNSASFKKYIISHRVHPSTLQGYLLVAHTAFHGDGSDRGHGKLLF
jgi:glycogen debranching enzyme